MVSGEIKQDYPCMDCNTEEGEPFTKRIYRKVERIKCSEEMPILESDSENAYLDVLIAIHQSHPAKGEYLKTVSAKWVRTTIRGKVVERWEYRDRICPWQSVYWMLMPEPPDVET